jgi:uncharacterized phage protein gp47/JayE
MYENQTFAVIINRMLDSIPDDVDKREGSIIYDALAPAASELLLAYIELDANINLFFADTSSGDFLKRRALDYGLTIGPATKAKRKGLFRDNAAALFDVPLASRFSISNLNYVVTERISLGTFILECESFGVVGNQFFGTMLPLDYIFGLADAQLSDVIIPGEEIESDEVFRQRILLYARFPSASGNRSDYINWSLEVPGVGGAQVVPIAYGPGTVGITIIDSNAQPASGPLVANVQDYISPVSGNGKAPILSGVTVTAAVGVSIDVTATIVLVGGYTLPQVKASFESALIAYLKSIAFATDPSVKYTRIGSLLSETLGVQDYSVLLVNGGATNIAVSAGHVAIKGTVTLT